MAVYKTLIKLDMRDSTVMSFGEFTAVGIRWVRTAFLKLWSADHKWSSGYALVVLLD